MTAFASERAKTAANRAVLCAAYWALMELSHAYGFVDAEGVAWAPVGFFAGALLWQGKWIGPPMMIVHALVYLRLFPNRPTIALGFPFAEAAAGYAAAWGIRKRPSVARVTEPFDVLALFAIAVAAGLLSALVGLAASWPEYFTDFAHAPWRGVLSWTLSCALGISFMTPLMSLAPCWRSFRPRPTAEILAIAAAISASIWFALEGFLPVALLVYPLAIWSGIRYREAGTSVSLLAASATSVIAVGAKLPAVLQIFEVVGHGALIWIQLTLLVTNGASLFVSSVVRAEADRQASERANRDKTRFMIDLSRHVREPLRAIQREIASVRGREEAAPSDARELLRAIERNVARALRLSGDVLDMSKVESGKLDVSPRDFSVDDMLSDLLARHGPRARAKNVALEVVRAEGAPSRAFADPERVHQIASNLLSNAIKFTSSGRVRLELRFLPDGQRERGDLVISVVDTGIGIPAGKRDELFRPFSRVHSSSHARVEGSGLGLALSRDLARAMGGDLRLVRSEPGLGSEFLLRVPTERIKRDSRPADLDRASGDAPPAASGRNGSR